MTSVLPLTLTRARLARDVQCLWLSVNKVDSVAKFAVHEKVQSQAFAFTIGEQQVG